MESGRPERVFSMVGDEWIDRMFLHVLFSQ
jgi:hypothetical protein